MIHDFHLIKPHKTLMQNSLWNHDCFPELPDLEPQGKIPLFAHQGPGIVRTLHLTLNIDGENREELLRGVYLKATYNNLDFPSVYGPVGDFFCDSFGGKSACFSGVAMAKRPVNSLFCYLPMPFEKSVILELENKTDKKVTGYGYVTGEAVSEFKEDMGYFHSKWIHGSYRLPQTPVELLDVKGEGHFLGCHLTAVSACPHFLENQGICEGNDEFYIDGSYEPVCNYLGTEDFFGFSWNWRSIYCDSYSGTTYLDDKDGVTKLACYRFLLNDPVRFSKSLRVRINYAHEKKNQFLIKAKREDNGDVEFGIAVYWYQKEAVSCI